MSRAFGNTPMATTANSASAVFIAALISAGTAAADDISKVTGSVGGTIPLKVVIVSADSRLKELGRTPDYKAGSFSIDLTEKVKKYHWEVFARNAKEPCDKLRDVSTPSITVPRPGKCEEKAGGGSSGSIPGGGQQPANAVTHLTLNHFAPTSADLNTMSLKESDVVMDVETTDLVNQRKQAFPMPVGTKTIDLAVDPSGTMRMTLKVTFRGKPCISRSVEQTVRPGTAGNTSVGHSTTVSAIRFRLTSSGMCAVDGL